MSFAPTNQTNSISNSKSSLEDTAKKLLQSNPLGNASGLLNGSASDLIKNLPNTLGSFGKTVDVNLSKVTSNFNLMDQLPNFNKLLNDNSNDISFISTTIKDHVKAAPFENPSLSIDNLTKLDSDSLFNLASRSGINSITNDMDLNKAFAKISDQQKFINVGKLEFDSSLYGMSLPEDNSFFSTVGKYVSSAVSTVTDYAKAAYNKLPDSIKNILNLDSGINNTNNKYDIYNNIISDENGLYVDGFSRSNYQQSADIYSTANDLCGTNNFNYKDYSNSKNMFDSLLDQILKNGLYGLLGDVRNCTKYYDSRSDSILMSGLTGASQAGDVNTVLGIVDTIGAGRVADKNNLVLVTASNMKSQDDYSILQQLCSKLGVSSDSLFKDQSIGSYSVTSGQQVTMLSNSSAASKLLDNDTLNKAILLYAKYA